MKLPVTSSWSMNRPSTAHGTTDHHYGAAETMSKVCAVSTVDSCVKEGPGVSVWVSCTGHSTDRCAALLCSTGRCAALLLLLLKGSACSIEMLLVIGAEAAGRIWSLSLGPASGRDVHVSCCRRASCGASCITSCITNHNSASFSCDACAAQVGAPATAPLLRWLEVHMGAGLAAPAAARWLAVTWPRDRLTRPVRRRADWPRPLSCSQHSGARGGRARPRRPAAGTVTRGRPRQPAAAAAPPPPPPPPPEQQQAALSRSCSTGRVAVRLAAVAAAGAPTSTTGSSSSEARRRQQLQAGPRCWHLLQRACSPAALRLWPASAERRVAAGARSGGARAAWRSGAALAGGGAASSPPQG